MSLRLHILGICGTFMGGLAAIAKRAGYRVSGCDANVYPPMSDQLAALGIELIEGYGAEQIGLAPDVWIIGNVVSRGNPLIEAILDRGDRYLSGPQWLAEQVLFRKWVLAVAGTHGKTSTASMLAWILERNGCEPTFLIGGVPGNFQASARLTQSRFAVIEADEYDTAFFDKRSKFVHYHPRTAVLNNLEYDHGDIFGDLAEIERQFHHFVRTIPGSGLIIANGGDAALERVLARGCWTPVERFDTRDGWEAGDPDTKGSFEVAWRGEPVGRVAWDLLGRHNQLNALAAIAAARHAGISAQDASAALGSFAGVKRRMELRGRIGGISVYDDFAHHPTAIRSTLAGLRRRVGTGRILAVLEPRSNTMKLGLMKDALPGSLADADLAFVYSAGLGWDAQAVFRPLGDRFRCTDSIDALVAAIDGEARDGDSIVTMSNGSFGGIHDRLLSVLARRRATDAA
jgi:UDP-N-acetylmuramate: L-alanyl-gamma-D-glutamyl-meso-diaminopimelate ligase